MNQLKLLQLNLKNFKGVRIFTLDARGENVKVFGDNATGKTTLFDAFVWLLFDKDSQNKKDFSIKTLVGGKEEHYLEHAVEATFELSGRTLTLKKVFTEKWTKKRGSATNEFSGHTTDYFIDGVPSKKKEFTDRVDSIVKEDIFKLLTSPSYFNEQLHWQDRRKILLDVCGDITEAEVIAYDNKLSRLPEILNGRSIEDHRKVIAARRSEINKELEKIPVRIDEITLNLPIIDGLNKPALEAEVSRLNGEIDEKMTLINNIRNGNAISEKQRIIQEMEFELLKIKQDHEAGSKDKVYQLRARLQEEKSNAGILESKISNLNSRKQMQVNSITSLNQTVVRMREEWHQVNKEEFTHQSECECPACGQSLPEERVQAAKDKALAAFNKNKAERLERIQGNGKTNKEQLEKAQKEIVEFDKEIEKISGQLAEKKESVAKLQTQLHQEESLVVDIVDNPMYASKLQEKQKVVEEIRILREATDGSINEVYAEIAELKANRDQKQADIGKFAYADQSKKRIEELFKQEKELAAEFENLESELYLTEEFIRSKVQLLEQKINSKFKYARFKLFSPQINGGLTEVCETLFDGVPYSSGLNNAARINVGLDIIATLSDHYGFSAPIFIDNSEAVTKLIDTQAQTICLVVSEQDKALRIQHIENSLISVDCEVIA